MTARTPDRILFVPVTHKGRVIGKRAFESRSTLDAVMSRDYPGRRYRVEVRRGQPPPYRRPESAEAPEKREAQAEPGPHDVRYPPRPAAGKQEKEVASG